MIFLVFFLFLVAGIYLVEKKPKIICRVPCTDCKWGYVEQNMTKEAVALKGRTAFIGTKEGKVLRFDDCFGLKKSFFSRKYTRHGDLFWAPIFSGLDEAK